MVAAQLVEQHLGLPLLVLHGMHELQQVLVADGVVRRSRGPPQEMEHHGPLQVSLRTGEVADGARRVDDLSRAEGVHQQGVEGQRDEEVETRDAGERPQRLRRRERGVAQHPVDPGVELLPLSSPAQVQGDDVVEIEAFGKLRGGQGEIGRQPLRHPAIEGHVAVAFPHRDELRADDGDHRPVLDVVQEIVPETLWHVGHGYTPWFG